MVDLGFLHHSQQPDRFEDSQDAQSIRIGGVFGRFETHLDMGHGPEIVDFIGLGLLNDAGDVHGIGQVSIVQKKPRSLHMGVHIEVVDAVGIEGGRSPLDAVDDVAFVEEKFGQVGPILPGDSSD